MNTPHNSVVTRAEFEQLKSDLHELKLQSELAAGERTKTLQLVSSMHSALMIPSPGQADSLLNRMAKVVINIESGERMTAWILTVAKILAALGVIGGAVAAFKWGASR